MRGTLTTDKFLIDIPGIIPAYAGNTVLDWESQDNPRDHPRVCGEHSFGVGEHARVPGSSPRMRGTLHVEPDSVVLTGIIPAYAGNTALRKNGAPSAWDHPRVCGEHRCVQWVERLQKGSSPRMRGTRESGASDMYAPGIIPAYAGNTEHA